MLANRGERNKRGEMPDPMSLYPQLIQHDVKQKSLKSFVLIGQYSTLQAAKNTERRDIASVVIHTQEPVFPLGDIWRH
jgi:hypothetical protein